MVNRLAIFSMVSTLLATVCCAPCSGKENKKPLTQAEVRAVIDHYAKQNEEYGKVRRQLPAEERRALRAKLMPAVPEASRIVAWAAAHPDDELTQPALRLVLEYSPFEPVAEDAIDVVIANHLDLSGEDFRQMFMVVSGTPPPIAEKCLHAFISEGKDRRTRGISCWGLGVYQAQLVSSAGDLGSILAARIPKQMVPYLKELDPGRAIAKSEKLLERASNEFGDIEINLAPGKTITLKEMAENDLGRVRREFKTLAIGKDAPQLDGPLLGGGSLKLSDFRGQVVVLSFWSTTCVPCMKLIPEERKLVEKYAGKPFALLGVNLDLDAEVAKRAVAKHNVTWRNWWDDAEADERISDNWNIRLLPTIYVIDRDGVIRHKHLRGEELTAAVDRLLDEK